MAKFTLTARPPAMHALSVSAKEASVVYRVAINTSRLAWLVLPALLLAAPPSHAADVPVEWKGFLWCGLIAGLTHYNLHEPITLTVTGHNAYFERHVLRADTTQETAYIERSGGDVAPDGHVTLTGGATVGRKLTYSASYTGKLPQAGGTTSLVGSQIWVGPPVGRFERPCHLDLSR